MNQEDYRKLVSGHKKGPAAAVLRFLLGIAGSAYSLAVRLRNLCYDTALFKAHRPGAPVISVGNITAGGTGKTPLVVWLCNEITRNSSAKTSDCRCAILTRGYKTAGCPLLDEPALLAQNCPNAKVVVNPNRVVGAAEAIAFGAEVLVMDDGFQHRRLARDLDIVAIDATIPFGYGKMLPAGLLREPLNAIGRASAVVITRTDQATEAELARIEQKIRAVKPDMLIARSIHAPVHVISANGSRINLEAIKGKGVFAFCGIGNPGAFFKTIKSIGANVVGSKAFDDHHYYTDDCLAEISTQAEHCRADLVLTTQKDWTKIAPLLSGRKDPEFAFLAIEMRFLNGQAQLRSLIEQALGDRIPAT
ncbi:MAG: tetraacyldisaccharide 4'-kinase [Sedimentisphaerales bacterium]|nr:tetraacyldisaccharide 4'-kinase [Sedimentisphaerales bacterium]